MQSLLQLIANEEDCDIKGGLEGLGLMLYT